MKLKCECCGVEREYEDTYTPFELGWDCPPHFTGPVTCPFCPTSLVLLGESHKVAHAKWEVDGGHPLDKLENRLVDDNKSTDENGGSCG